ncbi:metallophosphoesterase [Paenibacillus filicis]|uniref:Metallophosphoesterase n=1 Tax=Paenibacillus gyeongsangnamensis TaxID=3388067 RepID=A0ABT4QCJ6_9BACL|nr:metallophosphoesterase [Paenibacillus filicis]MCZ8514586.1 metallophosphoesterase [Paenibacillus filicis]
MTSGRIETSEELTRRAFLKKAGLAAVAAAGAAAAGGGYARWVEPRWLELTQVTVHMARLPLAMDGARVVQFSDLHLGFHYDAADLLKLTRVINSLRPDALCFTGDLVDYSVGPDGTAAAEALGAMQARLGKFAVLGNHDYYGKAGEVAELLGKGGFRVLRNESARLEYGGSRVWLAGVEDQWEGKPDLKQALKAVPREDCTVLLSHCPDYADIAAEHSVDLQLSGHSHGGQVRVPFYGHVFTPLYARKYVMGLYDLGGRLQLYVNRGIGVSIHPIRFWCRPELTVFTLKRKR